MRERVQAHGTPLHSDWEGWFLWLLSLIRRAIKEVEWPTKRHTHTHTLSSLGTLWRLVFLPTSHWGDFSSKTKLHSSLWLFRFPGLHVLNQHFHNIATFQTKSVRFN